MSLPVRSKRHSRSLIPCARLACLSLAGALLLTSPAHAVPEEAPLNGHESAKHACIKAVIAALSERLSHTPLFAGAPTDPAPIAADLAQMRTFYAARNNAPLWIDGYRLNRRAQKVMREIRAAASYGLDAKSFPLPAVTAMAPVRSGWPGNSCGHAEQLARAELRLTASALTYARHARGGRIDLTKINRDVDRKGEIVPPAEVLEALATEADPGAYLKSLHPRHPQYGYLMKALAVERARIKATENRPFPPGPVLRRGVRHPQVALLRQRLVALQFAKPSDKSRKTAKRAAELFDRHLARAVLRFQRAHKLKPDGVVGPNTRAALSAPHKRTLNTILVNLERWRQMPPELGRKYIHVNVPEYKLRVVHNGKVIHEERTVVGKRQSRTPIFSDRLEKVVFNPYWTVPQSIFLGEWGGRIPRGFSAQRRGGQWIVRQPPGPRNALGKIKFIFPNRHAVYMHDTPKKRLFRHKVRAFSHGCVRVRNPKRLAQVIMRDEAGWSPRRVDRLFRSRKNRPVRLANAVPVHITYFTAWADASGRLKTFDDIYGHDRRVAGALKYAPPAPPDRKRKKLKKRPSVVLAAHTLSRTGGVGKRRRRQVGHSQWAEDGLSYVNAKPTSRARKRAGKRKRRARRPYYGYTPWYASAFNGNY